MAIGAIANDNQPMETLHHRVRWTLLEPDATPVEEPSRMHSLVAPMTHAAGATTEAKKYNYLETFDRDPFMATSKHGLETTMGP
jgi:hypothetical protein